MKLRKAMYRNIKARKFQFGGAICLLFLSVMLYVALSMAITTLEERNEQFKEAYNQESFHFQTADTLSADQLREWEKRYDLELESRRYHDLNVDGDKTLRLFSVTDTINQPYFSKGSAPESAGEIAISSGFADQNGFELGDSLTIEGHTYTISGTVYLPDYVYMLEQETDLISQTGSFGIAVTPDATFQHTGGDASQQVLGHYPGTRDLASFKSDVNAVSAILKFLEQADNPRIQYVESEIKGAQSTMTALPLFILVLSIIMVLMLMKRRIQMQRTEIGTLMALGFRRGELFRHYLGYAWFVGLSGAGLGLGVGASLSIPITNMYGEFFNLPRISSFDWDPLVVILGFIVPLGLMIGASAIIIWKPLREQPLDLLRPAEISTAKTSWLEALPFFKHGSFRRRFRLRLLVRSKGRSGFIILGVMFSSILLLFGLMTSNAMDSLVDRTYKKTQTYDYAVHYRGLQNDSTSHSQSPYTLAEASVTRVNDRAVEDIEPDLYGIEAETPYLHLLPQGNQVGNGFIISAPLAAMLGSDEGDELTLTNAQNNEKLTANVIGVADIFIGEHIYYNRNSVNEFLGYPSDGYTAAWQDTQPRDDEAVYQVKSSEEIIAGFESASGPTRYATIGVAAFAVFIGVIVLSLLTNLIVEEHSASISLFKVMGFHNQEIARLVLHVYTPIVIIGYCLSLPVAGWIVNQIMKLLVEETGFLLPTQITWWMAGGGGVMILITYGCSLAFSKRKLNQVSLQEALNSRQD
ncbi:ABC transporter permease [Thalassobacillus sp. CUG 92003]|uniref:ABC transporter permease n=1 Tax=Thalassobacillus sp. CUG 92003 TaxID=2736641 RepID=UPI0015E7A3DC|nr:ABC transporter permease [Thalassobacillus sp. CUG 92003]